MKNICIGILLLHLFACDGSKNTLSHFKFESKLKLSGLSTSRINWLPHGFKFNKIQEFDSTLNMEVILVLPVSGISKLDQSVKSDIRNQLLEFEKNTIELTDKYGPHPSMPASFYCSVENIWEDSTFISYLMIVSFYNGIGVHGMTTYHTCNFDKRTEKIMEFDDFFDIKTTVDTLLLFNSIIEAVNQEGLWLETIYAMDFHLRDSTVVFAYDDYEIASYGAGIILAPIRKSTVSSLIKPEYR